MSRLSVVNLIIIYMMFVVFGNDYEFGLLLVVVFFIVLYIVCIEFENGIEIEYGFVLVDGGFVVWRFFGVVFVFEMLLWGMLFFLFVIILYC